MLVGKPGWPGKTRLRKDACRCLLLLGTLVSRETSADGCCRLVDAGGEAWLARKNKAGECRLRLELPSDRRRVVWVDSTLVGAPPPPGCGYRPKNHGV